MFCEPRRRKYHIANPSRVILMSPIPVEMIPAMVLLSNWWERTCTVLVGAGAATIEDALKDDDDDDGKLEVVVAHSQLDHTENGGMHEGP